MGTPKIFFLVVMIALIISCTNAENERAPLPKAAVFYREYTVWGEEEKEGVKIFLQLRRNNKNGNPLLLENPGKLMLDGEPLHADSAAVTGIFYETQKSLAQFAGEHIVQLTDYNHKEHIDTFRFTPFQLVNKLDDGVKSSQLLLKLEGLNDGDAVRVVATDTSFTNDGINAVYTIENGQLDLRSVFRKEIKNGPVMLQLFKEEERGLAGSLHPGHISITYGLKREFELKD